MVIIIGLDLIIRYLNKVKVHAKEIFSALLLQERNLKERGSALKGEDSKEV